MKAWSKCLVILIVLQHSTRRRRMADAVGRNFVGLAQQQVLTKEPIFGAWQLDKPRRKSEADARYENLMPCRLLCIVNREHPLITKFPISVACHQYDLQRTSMLRKTAKLSKTWTHKLKNSLKNFNPLSMRCSHWKLCSQNSEKTTTYHVHGRQIMQSRGVWRLSNSSTNNDD